MAERIVAYDGQNGYAQDRGLFSMPGKEPGETPRPEITPPIKQPRGEAPQLLGGGLVDELRKIQEQLGRPEDRAEKPEADEGSQARKRYRRRGLEPRVPNAPASEPTIVPTAKDPVIIPSFPHFENCSSEQIKATLERHGVKVDVPSEEEWRKMNKLEKARWAESHHIINVTAIPDEVTVAKSTKGGIIISGLREDSAVNSRYLEEVIKQSGLEFDVEFPKGFDEKSYKDKLRWCKDHGLKIGPAIAGAEVVGTAVPVPPPAMYDDNDKVDVATAYRRLGKIRDSAERLGVTPNVTDIDQLQSRIRSIDAQRRIAELGSKEEIENRLIELQHIEARFGPVDFKVKGFDEEQKLLYEMMRVSINKDGRINDVLETLRNLEIQIDKGEISADDPEYRVWRGYLNHILGHVRTSEGIKRNFRFVFNASKAIDDFAKVNHDGGTDVLLNRVISKKERDDVRDATDSIDAHFQGKEAAYKNPGKRDALRTLYEEVDTAATSYRSSITYGSLTGMKDVETRLFDVEGAPVYEAAKNEQAGEKGLVEWHAVKTLEEMNIQQIGQNEMDVPLDWHDSKRNVDNNLRYAESGDFSEQDLRAIQDRISKIQSSLAQRVNQMKGESEAEKEERGNAEDMLSDINDLKDAVLAIYDLRLAMEGKDMNPEEVVQHFGSHIWKDTTFQTYFKRFAKDENNQAFRDGKGEFNIQDRAMQVLFKQLAQERRDLNLLEAMTIVDITTEFKPGDARYAEMARIMGRGNRTNAFSPDEVKKIEELRKAMYRGMEKHHYNPGDWGQGNSSEMLQETGQMKDVINDWYRNNTFLGAYGTYEGDDPKYQGKQNIDFFRGKLLDDFEARLVADGVDKGSIAEYKNSGLLNQVVNNAYHLSFSLGAFSDYDGIRVWDRKAVWFTNEQRGEVYRLGSYVFNNGSSWFHGRMVDHYTEFLQDEFRGRPRDANFEFTKNMIGKNRSVLGHNRLLSKIILDNLSQGSVDPTVKDNLVAGHSETGVSYDGLLKDKMKNIENGKRLDIEDKDDKSWLRGASVEELMQDGELTLEEVKWSEIFSHNDKVVKKFNMGDWWGDRAAAHKYFNTEAMQQYLKTPNTDLFFKMNESIFYSKREIRIQPWMKLVIPAHQDLGRHWQEWWKLPYDMPHREIERVIDKAARLNMIRYAYVSNMRGQYLGWGPFSGNDFFGLAMKARFIAEAADRGARETGKDSWQMPFGWGYEIFRLAMQQSQAQLAGK